MSSHVSVDRADPISGNGPVTLARRPEAGPRVRLRVLGRFALHVGDRSIRLGLTSQRLLVLLAIRSGQVSRAQVAGVLWPDTGTARAAANLRSTLWRIQRRCNGVVQTSFYDLSLAPEVAVDLNQSRRIAYQLRDGSTEIDLDDIREAMRCNLYEDVAPDVGDDEWLAAERERFRQLRVHALETLVRQVLAIGWYGTAVEAALGAVRADPFRESAYQLLIKAHLAEGSWLDARRHYAAYCDLLQNELGLAPSEDFLALLDEEQK